MTYCNLLCLGILEDKNPYGVNYHLLQIGLAKRKISFHLNPFIVWVWIARVHIAKRYFLTHADTGLANLLELEC